MDVPRTEGFVHTVCPATGIPHPPVPATPPHEISAVVARARRAACDWEAMGLKGRADLLERCLSRLAEPRVEAELAETITSEMGKPVAQARSEVQVALRRFAAYVERAEQALAPRTGREGDVEVTTAYRPLGVAAVIGPWNYPVATPNNLVLSSLLMGNTCVFKPSEVTPRTGAAYADLFAGKLPEGVFQVVQGGAAVGRALLSAPVDLVAFTGSVATGQAILRAAADHMTRAVLEMGGKDPMIVLPGADLSRAAAFAARQGFLNSGQVCVSVERILVHRSIEEPFSRALAERVAALTVGDPAAEDTDLGPLATARQRDHVRSLVEDAVARGAQPMAELRWWGPGYFMAPVILRGVTADMRIAREETFGPVVTVEVFDALEEAVALANATPYGLGASVWGPQAEAEAVAPRLAAGMVGVNRGLSAAAGAPWVGWKMSGYGYARSVAGMQQFAVPQTVSRPAGT